MVANPTVTLTNTTAAPLVYTYTLTATSTFAGASCDSAATVTVTVNQAAAPLPGAARSVCSGLGTALGAAPVAGNTYSWSPTTDLSNPTIANPVATITNTTNANTVRIYTLTTTTAQGCPATGTVTVTVFPAPVANAGTDQIVCSGTTLTLGSPALPGYTYQWTADPFLSSINVAQPTYTPINTSTVPFFRILVVTVTTPDGCVGSAQVRVDVNPAAVAQAAPPTGAPVICSGKTAQLGNGPGITTSVYSWSPVAGLSNPALANPTVTLTNTTASPIARYYVLRVSTTNGCSAIDSVLVTVNPGAVAQAGANATFCSGKTAQLGGSGPAIAGSTYAWMPITGLSNAAIFNPTVTLVNTSAAPIVTRYRLLVTTTLGCVDSSFVTVTVNPAAVAQAGATPAALCSGNSATLGTGPAVAGATYAWTPTTGLTTPTAPTTVVTLTNTTNAPFTTRYRLLVTTALGCVDSAFVNITVNPAPIVNAGRDTTLCALKRVTLGTPAQPGYGYQWTPTAGLSSAQVAQPVLTAANLTNAPITTTYFLTVTTPQGCPGRDSVRVTVNPRPAADSIVGPASVCPTVTGIAYLIRTPRATAYQWLVTGAVAFTGQGTPAIAVDWGPAGTGSVKAYTLNSLGCSSDTVTLPILINTRLQTATPTGPGNVRAVAPLPRSVCQADGPYTYATVYANGSLYSWTILGGTQTATSLAAVTVQWNPVTVPTIGKIVVTETSNPASGVRCLGSSDTLRVLINPSPVGTLAITGPAAVCQGSGPATFGLPGGFAGSTYTFTLGGAALPGTASTAILNPLPAPGSYVVTARETSVAGCAGPTFTFNFVVNPTPVAPVISGSAFVCDVALAQPYSVPATPGTTYAWTVTGGTVAAGQGTAQVSVQFTAGAVAYAVSVVPSSQFGCVGGSGSLLVRLDNPSLTLAVASVASASNASVVLTFSSPASGNTPNLVQVLRRVAGIGAFTAVGTVLASATTYTDAGVDAAANSYEYQLSLTNGCGTVLSSVLTQTIRLVATATPGTGGRDQGRTALTWNPYVGFGVNEYQILRSVDGGPETPVGPALPAATTTTTVPNGTSGSASGAGFTQTFRVVAVGPGGLRSNSNTANTRFENPVVTYNVITPNNDGLNDVLVIDNIGLYPGNEFTVFNRWGREVYRTTNYQNTWGGDANTAAGNYYFLLKTADGLSRKGWFEVVK